MFTLTLTDDLDFGTKETVFPKNIYVKYEISITYHSKAIANVKAFTDKQTDKRTGQKLYAPDLSTRGYKKIFLTMANAMICYHKYIQNTVREMRVIIGFKGKAK